jgi:rhodanese-related sulfurtransferase
VDIGLLGRQESEALRLMIDMKIKNITPNELQEFRNNNKFFLLLDVGKPAEYREMHVDNARLVPIDSLGLMQIMTLGKWSREVPLVFISRLGKRAAQACREFVFHGFENVFYLEGGSKAWEKEGRPVVCQKENLLARLSGMTLGIGILLPVLLSICGLYSTAKAETPVGQSDDETLTIAKYIAPAQPHKRALEERMKADSLGFLREARERFLKKVPGYSCNFVKQELIQGKMSKEQHMAVKCRHEPFSVAMEWTKNADRARKVLYVEGEIVGKHGEMYAKVQPNGWLARLVVNSVERDIHGKDARKSARRYIDQFGFANSLELIIRYAEIAKQRGDLDLVYSGEDQVEGRPTYRFERRLPYSEKTPLYPDALLIVHIDQEWFVPLLCESYADHDKEKLLGRYLLKDVNLNAKLTKLDFTPEAMGL